SPVTSAKALTRSWVISSQGLTPSSWPISVLSSSTVRTTRSGVVVSPLIVVPPVALRRGHPPGKHLLQDPLAVEVGVAVERFQMLGVLEVEVQVVLPGEADPAMDLDRVAADLARRL